MATHVPEPPNAVARGPRRPPRPRRRPLPSRSPRRPRRSRCTRPWLRSQPPAAAPVSPSEAAPPEAPPHVPPAASPPARPPLRAGTPGFRPAQIHLQAASAGRARGLAARGSPRLRSNRAPLGSSRARPRAGPPGRPADAPRCPDPSRLGAPAGSGWSSGRPVRSWARTRRRDRRGIPRSTAAHRHPGGRHQPSRGSVPPGDAVFHRAQEHPGRAGPQGHRRGARVQGGPRPPGPRP